MTREEFVEKITADIAKKITDVTIHKTNVKKTNRTYEALVIKKESMGICLDLDALYNNVKRDGYDVVYENVIESIKERDHFGEELKSSLDLDNEESVKKRLICSVVSAEKNEQLLSDIPYRRIGDTDLVFIYKIQLNADDETIAHALVQNGLLELLHMTNEELHKVALQNTSKNLPVMIKSLYEIVHLKPDDDDQIRVVSNCKSYLGATALFYPGVLEEIEDKVGGGYYVLPSSIHEVLIYPETMRFDIEYLSSTVRVVNRTQVLPEDVLSDNVYHYDTVTGFKNAMEYEKGKK
ncbi:MAG: DUF5688 family protein [Eubacteriales bacterium]|nr:DUF5688 family protein [Eubacteriales bacterium]